MDTFGYDYLLGEQWLSYSIAVAAISFAASIFLVKRMPNRPWQAFMLSCLAAYLAAFLVSGFKIGLSGGGEAIFWNAFGAVVFAPIWFPVCAIVHIILRRDQIRRR